MRAEVICTGTELLLGQIINTNAQIFSRGLADLGIDLYTITTIGDNQARIEEAIRHAQKNADIIILNGGLGPTEDDCTREALVRVLGIEEEVHQPTLKKIQDYGKSRSLALLKNNEKVALVPQGSVVFTNGVGSAPASAVVRDAKVYILTPGPPHELTYLLERGVYPWLKKTYGLDVTIASRVMKVINIGESDAEEMVRDLVCSTNPTLAPTIKKGELHFRITAKADNVTLAHQLLDEMEDKFRAKMGHYVYGKDNETLEMVIGSLLREHGLQIACAESCTGGLLASTLTDVSGASDYLTFSAITYSDYWKTEFLDVPLDILHKRGAVSPETVKLMADGIRHKTGADIGLSISGIAGPTGGSLEKPVGLVYLGISMVDGTYSKKILLSGDRLFNKELSVKKMLGFLYELLCERYVDGEATSH